MLIGLTGQMGAGKTTVSNYLSKLGAKVIDADSIGRAVLANSLTVKRHLVRTFGGAILDSGDRIKRKSLARLAFANQKSLQRLNRIMHPPLLKELRSQINRSKRNGVVVLDAALLLEWGLDKLVDIVIVVEAPATLRLSRMIEKGFEPSDIRKRMKLQPRRSAFNSKADIVIHNGGKPIELRRAVKYIWSQLHEKG